MPNLSRLTTPSLIKLRKGLVKMILDIEHMRSMYSIGYGRIVMLAIKNRIRQIDETLIARNA